MGGACVVTGGGHALWWRQNTTTGIYTPSNIYQAFFMCCVQAASQYENLVTLVGQMTAKQAATRSAYKKRVLRTKVDSDPGASDAEDAGQKSHGGRPDRQPSGTGLLQDPIVPVRAGSGQRQSAGALPTAENKGGPTPVADAANGEGRVYEPLDNNCVAHASYTPTGGCKTDMESRHVVAPNEPSDF